MWYSLDEHNNVVESNGPSDKGWRRVDEDWVGNIHISTVFLGLEHGHYNGLPLVFETKIFNGEYDDYQERCCTYREAQQQHAEALFLVKASLL